ncbi:hypothetical protein AWC38_SpisGene11989 [Stylophora pistillata]|uniref:Reverse transcriptase domain-containing protein n=1 Tax=Stylophora pistillata TaxID=50429 RepID=A0A2B4RYE3_STYPI|nr:hypothetical protein AWC38_SpisGene11989 [Stylophora pistillata]
MKDTIDHLAIEEGSFEETAETEEQLEIAAYMDLRSTQQSDKNQQSGSAESNSGAKKPTSSQTIEQSINTLINQSSESQRDVPDGEIDQLSDIVNDLKLDQKKAPPINEQIAKIVHGLMREKLTDEVLTARQYRYNTPENCEYLTSTKARDKILKDALDDPELIRAATDAIALIGAANFELNMRRRENIKPELNEDYKHLCSSSVPFTDFLFGNDADLSKQLKDLAEATKVSKKLNPKVEGHKSNGYRAWRDITDDPEVLDWVEHCHLEFVDDVSRVQELGYKVIKFNDTESAIIDSEIVKLLNKGVIVESPHSQGEFVSSIFLRLKKNGVDYRMILNLKELNQFIVYRHFKMDSLKTVTDLMTQGCFMASVDIRDTYYTVSIAIEHQKYLKFMWRDELYRYTCLPNGLASAPRIFNKLLKAMFNVLRKKGNFPIHEEKSVLVPPQVLTCQGFVLNSITMTVQLTDSRKEKLKNTCLNLVNKENSTVQQVAEVIGLLVSSFPETLQKRGFSERATNIVLQSWRQSSQKQYDAHIRKWLLFCTKRQADPTCHTIDLAVEFLTTLYDEGLSYSSINSATLDSPASAHHTFGGHPDVKRFMKGVFQSRPPLPSYSKTWSELGTPVHWHYGQLPRTLS